MRDAAKNRIRSAEPYKNGKGHNLWVLHKLDITDKHRALLTAIYTVPGIKIPLEGNLQTGYVWSPLAAPHFGDMLEVGKTIVVCKPEKYKDLEITFDIAITETDVFEPKPLLWAMKFLIDKVDSLIIEFKPDFV
jgi:hypothetical protein